MEIEISGREADRIDREERVLGRWSTAFKCESRRGPGDRIYAPLPRDAAVVGGSMRPPRWEATNAAFFTSVEEVGVGAAGRGWRG